jgi:DNA ligase-1
MRAFAALYQRLDRTSATGEKLKALSDYFQSAAPEDAAWALWLLSGGKVGGTKVRIATSAELRAWAAQASGLPDWLVDASHEQVGDLAETLALLLDDPSQAAASNGLGLSYWIEKRILPVANADPFVRQQLVVATWRELPFAERLIFNKLLTGALRIGVSHGLVQKALAAMSGIDVAIIAQRVMGKWIPSAQFMHELLSPAAVADNPAAPYPFFLASPLTQSPAELGSIEHWQLEWKWDGIRVQLIRRGNTRVIWSRGEERLDGRFPEIELALATLKRDVVIDGELLAWRPGEELPLPFAALQTRIQRRKPGPKMLEQAPVRVVTYDVLEIDGVDVREQPLVERRRMLEEIVEEWDGPLVTTSAINRPQSWDEAAALRDQARARGVEGLMLKRLNSPYRHGRKRGDWWKWKVDPLVIDAVLIYAQSGHGRRSTLFTDYTFGLWEGERLVPVAKAYSGLTDEEILKLDRWIRANTTERFGPVRAVEPIHVFELGFEAVNASTRHKSGVAVRFPRILRWRVDKPAAEADRLATLKALAR